MDAVFLIYLGLGAIAGILAGLLGIGGGLVIVPMLVFAFGWLQFPDSLIMHLALGTSMASIVVTSVSSCMAHHRRGAVCWPAVWRIAIGINVGTFMGTCLAARLSTGFLKGFFVIFLYYVALQMLMKRNPKPGRELPGFLGMSVVGWVIGGFSSLVGIGGGTLSVPFLLWCNLPLHTAIGTSAAIGFPIALAGTAGYIYNGWQAAGLPAGALGFVYLPALLGLVAASVLTAPLGARLAHSLPVDRLKSLFALLLFVVATKMGYGLFAAGLFF